LDGLHDRFIVASAKVADNRRPVPLVTADLAIRASRHVPTIW